MRVGSMGFSSLIRTEGGTRGRLGGFFLLSYVGVFGVLTI